MFENIHPSSSEGMNKESSAGAVKGLGWGSRSLFKNIRPNRSTGTNSVAGPAEARFVSPQESARRFKEQDASRGTGSFTGDGILGITKRIAPKTKEPIERTVGNVRQSIGNANRSVGEFLRGNNPNSLRYKAFTTNTRKDRLDLINPDGTKRTLSESVPEASAMATPQRVSKFSAPLLGAMYVGDKLYPEEEVNANPTEKQAAFEEESVNQTPYANESDETTEEEKTSMSVAENMDKIASLQKIAKLEEEVEKYASAVNELEMEKTAIQKELEMESEQRSFFEKRASEIKEDLMEKRAEFDELHLRTMAQKRSKVAVDLAEGLLERDLIKQAKLEETIDDLMDADESTIKIYENMLKEASHDSESVESLSILREYIGNERLASASNSDGRDRNRSKRGQTIGEAASDLNKAR